LHTSRGGRAEYLLCAHVDGDLWFCHDATHNADGLDDAKPFDPCDMQLKNICEEAWT
jgi:hypothetical protein